MTQIGLFDGTKKFKIDNPIRLIELFAGIGAQAKALENLGVPFEHYRICEFDKYAVKSYNAVHGTDFPVSDITKIHADDLGIVDTEKYCYIMTYSFPCTDLSLAGERKGMAKGSGTRSGLLWEVERLLDDLEDYPAADVQEVRHGKWIECDYVSYDGHSECVRQENAGLKCSNCNRAFKKSWIQENNYCPRCGAKMDGKDDG